MEKVTQTLAGRAAILKLLPLSMEELILGGFQAASYEELIYNGFYPRL